MSSIRRISTLIFFSIFLLLAACSPAQTQISTTPTPVEESEPAETDPDAGTDESAGDAEEATLPTAESACANGLFPLEVGNQWVYALDPDESLLEAADPDPSMFSTFTWTVVDVTDTQATLEMSSEEPAFTATYTLDCEQGAILTFPSVTLDMALGGGEFGSADFQYSRGSGVFLPSVETLESNNWDYEWQTVLLLSGEISTVIDDTQEFLVTMEESPFFFDWSTAGSGDAAFEKIEVLAGEFEALKLDLTTDMTFSMDMAGQILASEFTTDENQWYAPGIGLLQTQTNSATMEFSGFSMPMEDQAGDISLMLVEFRSAAQ